MAEVESGRVRNLHPALSGSAGWVGDVDADGAAEWFVPINHRAGDASLLRIDLAGSAPEHVAWGGYLGTRHDGAY